MQDTVYMVTFTADQALLLLAVIMVIAFVGWLIHELFTSYSKIKELQGLLDVHNIDTESRKDELLVEKDLTISNLRAELGERQATVDELMAEKKQKADLLAAIDKKNRYVMFLKGIHAADLDYHTCELAQLHCERDRLLDRIAEKDERIQELENVCAENGIEVIPLDMDEPTDAAATADIDAIETADIDAEEDAQN